MPFWMQRRPPTGLSPTANLWNATPPTGSSDFRSFGYGGIGDPNTYGGMRFIGDPNTFGPMTYSRTGAMGAIGDPNTYGGMRAIGDPNTYGGIGDPNTFGSSRGIIIYGRDAYGRTYFKGGWGWDPSAGWFWHGVK